LGWTQSKEGKTTTGNEYSVELGKTFELGGKRKARVDLAKSNVLLSKAQLEDYFRNLRSEAALVYLEALKQQSLFKVKNDSWYVFTKQLADGDVAVSILNIGTTALKYELNFSEIGLPDKYEIRDVWKHKVVGNGKKWKGEILSHETKVFRLKKN